MRKLALVQVSYRGDFLISYRVYIEGTLHADKIHVSFKITNVTDALPIPVYRQTDFTPKRVVI